MPRPSPRTTILPRADIWQIRETLQRFRRIASFIERRNTGSFFWGAMRTRAHNVIMACQAELRLRESIRQGRTPASLR
jgi:hypothetical protein